MHSGEDLCPARSSSFLKVLSVAESRDPTLAWNRSYENSPVCRKYVCANFLSKLLTDNSEKTSPKIILRDVTQFFSRALDTRYRVSTMINDLRFPFTKDHSSSVAKIPVRIITFAYFSRNDTRRAYLEIFESPIQRHSSECIYF